MLLKLMRALLLMALPLLLAGCFRPAGDVIEPTDNQNPPPAIPTLPIQSAPTTQATPEAISETALPTQSEAQPSPFVPASGSGSPTFPPITVIAPTRAAPTQANAVNPNATAQPQFITPGVPAGPISTDVPITTPSGGAFTSTPSGMVTPTALPGDDGTGCSYTVQPGDTLYKIATANDLTVDEMKAANDLTGENPVLQPGQILQIPGCGGQQQPDTSVTTVPTPFPAGSGEVYTVQAGDTLFKIAQHYGITVDAIVAANNLPNPDRLDVGQQIVIPPS